MLNGLMKRSASAVAPRTEQEPPAKKAKAESASSTQAQPVVAKAAGKAATTPTGTAAPKSEAPKAAAVQAAATEKLTPPAASKRAREATADFQPAARFSGARPGFAFKKGPQGLGYYRDKPPVVAASLQKAQAQPKAQSKPEEKGAAVVKQLKGGLTYEVLRPGRGPAASPGKSVQVRYEGRLAKNGKRFDKGVIKFKLGVGEVIQGWDKGVNGMLRGEKRRLKIPSQMGYGQRGAPPDIPRNADLVFEVELLQC